MSYTKYYVFKQEASQDGGETWGDTGIKAPSGNPIATYDSYWECDYQSFDTIYVETNENGEDYVVRCSDTCSVAIDSDDINLMSSSNNYASLRIGACCYSVALENSISKVHYFKEVEMDEGILNVGTLLAVFDRRTTNTGYTISIPDSVLSKGGIYEYGNKPSYNRPCVGFSQNSNLEIIGYGGLAYHGMTGFTSPPKVYYVGGDAFSCCGNLKTLTIGAEFVDNIASECPNLTDITFTSNNLKAIGGWNENIPSLTSVTIPSSVVYVGAHFWAKRDASQTGETRYLGSLLCTNTNRNYTDMTVVEGTKYISLAGGWGGQLMASATTFPTSLISIVDMTKQGGRNCLIGGNGSLYYVDSGKTYVDSIVDSGKTTYSSADFEPTTRFIGTDAFKGNGDNITSVVVPEGVVQLCRGAFSNCYALTSVTLPSTLLSIDDDAFAGCGSLSDITIPNSVQYIGRRVFNNCTGLTSVTLSTGITQLSNTLFGNCTSLTSLTIPSSVKIIKDGAFGGCSSLTGLSIPSSVKIIEGEISLGGSESHTFSGCTAMTSLVLNDGVNYIGSLSGAPLASLSVPASVRSIVEIPDTVTSLTFDNNCQIKEMPFYNCGRNLTTLTLPPSVVIMGRWQIINWYNIMQDLYLTSPCVVRLNLPLENYQAQYVNYRIHVPSYLLKAYKKSDYWKAVANKFVAI